MPRPPRSGPPSRAPDEGYTHALLSTALAYATGGAPATLLPGLRSEATREANRALALNPHLGAPYIALGKIAENARDYARAETLYRRGIAADPRTRTRSTRSPTCSERWGGSGKRSPTRNAPSRSSRVISAMS